MNSILRAVGCMALTALLSACASVHPIHDGDKLDPNLAYLALRPHLGIGESEGFLTRIDEDGSTHRMKLSLPARPVQVVAVPPGLYYVDTVHYGHVDYMFKPRQSAFRAIAGKLSYPGDWYFSARVVGDFRPSLHDKTFLFAASLQVVDELDAVVTALAQSYPNALKMGEPAYTRVVLP